jgi:hypothetical protein
VKKPTYFAHIVDTHGTSDQHTPIEMHQEVRDMLQSICPRAPNFFDAIGAEHAFDTATEWDERLLGVIHNVTETLEGARQHKEYNKSDNIDGNNDEDGDIDLTMQDTKDLRTQAL